MAKALIGLLQRI